MKQSHMLNRHILTGIWPTKKSSAQGRFSVSQQRLSLEVSTERMNGHCSEYRALSFIHWFLFLFVCLLKLILEKQHELSGHPQTSFSVLLKGDPPPSLYQCCQ